jgi:GNAT superfamily N-acetyltransferase
MRHSGPQSSDGTDGALDLRPADAGDAPFLREMLYLALFVPPGTPPLDRAVLDDPAIDRYVREWGAWPGDVGVVAHVDTTLVGAAWLRCFSADAPGYGFVDGLIPELTITVMPGHRGRRVGTRMLAYLQQRAMAISLSCDPSNPAARLYRRAGFEPWSVDGRTMLWRRHPQ